MGHRYYSDEVEGNNQQRLKYFDEQFEALSKKLAQSQGITLSSFLSEINDISSFKAKLEEVFSADASLASYVSGMSNEDFRDFFDRPIIQDIVDANSEDNSELIEEEIIPEPPVKVEQVEKETRSYFRAIFVEKDTGKKKRTIGYEDTITIKGKKSKRLRDSRGRFVKRT